MIRKDFNIKISISAIGHTLVISINDETITFKRVLNTLNGYFASMIGDYRITFNKLSIYGINIPLDLLIKDLSDEYKRIVLNLGLNHNLFKTDLPDIFGSDGYRISISIGDRTHLNTSFDIKEYIDITELVLSEIGTDKEKCLNYYSYILKKLSLLYN